MAIYLRSNLAQSIKVLSRFCSNSRSIHVILIKQIFRYVFDIVNKELVFNNTNIIDDVVEYIDFDFVDAKFDRKSIEDYTFLLARAAINYLFKLQIIVALFTCEVEYVAICEIDKKIV